MVSAHVAERLAEPPAARRDQHCDRASQAAMTPPHGAANNDQQQQILSRLAPPTRAPPRRGPTGVSGARAGPARLAALAILALYLLAGAGAHASARQGGRHRRQEPASSGADLEAAPTTTSVAPATSSAAPSTTTPAPSTTSAAADADAPGRRPSKIAPVNYTRVDELFEHAEPEADVADKWRRMDKTIHAGVGQLLKMVFPHIVAMSSDAKVSGHCSGAILKWILSLKNMRVWAVRMLDAIGKPSAGLLEGSLTMFGNYRQCLSVRAPDEDEIEIADGEFREYFRGQYCVLQIRPPLPAKRRFYSLNSTIAGLMRKSVKYYERNVYDELAELAMAFNFINIRADLCVPSLCSRDDIQRVADFLAAKLDMRARVQRCDVQPAEPADGQPGPAPLELGPLLWLLAIALLLLLVLASTLTSVAFRFRRRTSKSTRKSLFTSMSLLRSLRHMRDVQLDRIADSKPVALYALRLLLLGWICLVSLTSQLEFQYLREMLSLRALIMLWPMQLIVNSALAYDALILLTAFTYAYQCINANVADLVKYNVAKYSRLMPSIMLMTALTILTPLLYPWRSPVWHDFVQQPADACQSSGLVNLLFVQNLLDSRQMCLPQTWLFCVELQLCVLAIPLVYLLNRSFEAQRGSFRLGPGPLLLLALALLGCLVNFVNVRAHQLPAAWFQTFPDRDDRHHYNTLHLHRAASHLTTFAVGLFAGHLCRCLAIETFSGRPYGRRCCNSLMWLTSGMLMFALVFGTHAWSLSGASHIDWPWASAAYAALAPLLWALAWSLVLFQLTVPNDKNQRSCLARLLAADVNLIRLGRLSFLAYLINPYVNTLIYAVQEQPIFSSIIMLAHTFIGNLVITFALAIAVSALVELPCRRAFKKLLLGSRRQCTNLDIITRQLNISQQNLGPSHDSFLARAPSGPAQPLNQAAMIPLK